MRHYGWLILLLLAVAVISVGGALSLSLGVLGGSLQYKEEWVQALLQVGLIAVLGIVTSGVLELFKDSLQRRRDLSRLRFDVLTELSRAYMDVKLERRKIKAARNFTPTEVDRLNELQVIFELHKRNSCHMFNNSAKLEKHLDVTEKYLNRAANKDTSRERRDFCSTGFKPFADAYEAAAAQIRHEIASQ